LQVEVLETKDGTSNAGEFCRYCVLDALQKLDDRPVRHNAGDKPPQVGLD